MHAGNILNAAVKKFDTLSLVFSTERLACLLFLMLAMINLPTWAATLSSPVVVTDQVTVTYSGYTLNRTTNTYDTLVTLSNKSSSTIEIPIQLAISNISQTTVTLANASGVMADGTPYVNIPLSDNTLSPGETVKGILLKFNNPKRVSFTFSHSVLGVLPMANHPPIANAGSDSSAPVGNQITLSGMASSDEDGDNLSYRWRIVDKPATSSAQLTSTNSLQTQLTIDRKGDYRIELIVNDGQADSQPDLVVITTENSKPVAAAGEDQTVFVQQTANLDGVNSKDIDDDIITFKWQLVAKPTGSQAALQNETTQTPGLTPDKPGDYTIELIVNDGEFDSDPDRVIISTQNSKPIADAGPNLQGIVGQPVILDGQLSKDVDDDPLSFVWSLLNNPANSKPELQNDDQPKATLIPDLPGDYVSQLIVNDGHVNSDPDTALVTVSVELPVNNPPQITSSSVLSAIVDQNYNYDVDATDSDNDTLSYSLSTFPTGMAINSQSGLISWIPTSSQTGTQSVTINVIDGNGGNDSQSFIITVTDTPILNQTTVPDVTGLARSAAQVAIQQAKLNIGTETFQHSDSVPDGKVISQSPIANNKVDIGTTVNTVTSLGPDNNLPPNPETIAPRLDPTVATNTYAASEFLYKGRNPIQTLSNGEPLAQGTIEPRRAAVIRGKVLDKQNNPLSGVTLTILNHPEYGQTKSRLDGQFDLVVNGGGYLTVNYQKNGYLTLQRQISVPWQDYADTDDVVLIQFDSQVTTIELDNATNIQVARGNPVTDEDGTRQATILFPAGTTATMALPDGSEQPLSTLHVRATEYTVGANGPQAMPAELPPTSAYTYAVELSVDEANAAGAKTVHFSQPVPMYVDNFLHFPAGTTVPVGFYDREKSAWIPENSGVVIEIMALTNGLAEIDADGDHQADTPAQLNALGITDAERQQLAMLYGVNQSVWRVRVNHFSPFDCNWPIHFPRNAIPPNPPRRPRGNNDDEQCPNTANGSIIECENQVLGESITPGSGIPYALNYRSNWQSGYRKASLDIPISGTEIPDSLERIDLVIHLDGKVFKKSFPPLPLQNYRFDWDGMDAYGRVIPGTHSASVQLGFVYHGVYERTFKFAEIGMGLITGDRAREELTIWEYMHAELKLEGWVPRSAGLGGWSLNMHHVYDPKAKTLYLGSGQRRGQEASSSIITNVAGNGEFFSYTAEDVPATSFGLEFAFGLASAPDGSIYITNDGRGFSNRCTVHHVSSDGVITTVAGKNQACGYGGDNGPAISARINGAKGIAVGPDGSLYIADTGNHRIRRVSPDGIITTIAGNGQAGFSGDDGPATNASLSSPWAVAVAADGSFYIADTNNNRIRRVGTDGIIKTVAGNGQVGFSGDGGIATAASFISPFSIAVSAEGYLYIPDKYNARVRIVAPSGIISTFAGTGSSPGTGIHGAGDGGLATAAELNPEHVALGPDGSLYIADPSDGRVRRVGPDRIISTVAGGGSGNSIPGGIDGPATASRIQPGPMAWTPDGSLYVQDDGRYIRRIAPSPLPGFSFGDISIASNDGSELYQFTAYGRHLRTLDTLTGATIYAFVYDQDGQLATVTDRDGNVTTVERDVNGNPTAIVAPFGQRTDISLDGNGYLTALTKPAMESYRMAYTDEGLLTSFVDPNNHESTMTYDVFGRLSTDIDANGGSKTLAREDADDGFKVTQTTALGRSTTYGVTKLLIGDKLRTSRFPDGTQVSTINSTNGTHTTTEADGTVTTQTSGPDPRFSMQAPITSKSTVATGGLTSTLTGTRTVTLANPDNPLSLTSLTHTVTLNGRTSTSIYDSATKMLTNTSAAGRKAAATLHNLGRIVQAQVTGILDTNLSYDTRGRLAAISQGSSPDDRKATFSYNPEGYLDTFTDSLGRTASFEYDAAGRITRQTMADGRDIAYTYDAKGNLTSLTPPGKPGHLFHYTTIDQTAEYEPPLFIGTGNTLYSYDLDKALTKITRPDGQKLDFAYDNAGRLSNLTLPNGDLSYAYSATTGKLTSVTDPDGGTLAYTYNGALLTKTAWTGIVAGSVERSYDNDFRVTSLSINGANPLSFQYDADSLLIKAGNLALTRSAQNGLLTGTSLGSLTDSYSYNGFPEVTAYEAKYGTSSLLRFEYDHDKLGRITQKRQIKGGITHTFDYGYDTAGRLSEIKRDGLVTASYGYDSNGNRTHLNGSKIAQYDDQDRLLEYQGATYQYTANGELQQMTVNGQTTQYDYDVLGNLRKVTFPNGTVIDYIIDGQNRRIGKKRNGALEQSFLYQSQLRPIAELDSNGNITSRFVYATGVNVPDYMVKGGATYRIIKDHLGSPRLVLDVANNTIVQEMDYDAFGRVIQDTNPGFQPFGFAGGLYDRDTKFVRFGARDYHAETGRWVTKDPILFKGGTANLYSYSLSNPENLKDSSGLTDGGVRITITDPGGRNGPTYGGTITATFPDGGSVSVRGSSWPNPSNPSPGITTGSWPSTFGPAAHRGTRPGVTVNNRSNIPTNNGQPNPAQDGGAIANGINIHCGSTATNRGSAGCITIDPAQCGDFFNLLPAGENIVVDLTRPDGGIPDGGVIFPPDGGVPVAPLH